MRNFLIVAVNAVLIVGANYAYAGDPGYKFYHFESGQVRPLAMSRDKKYVFAVNTPDNRLEIFKARKNALSLIGSIPVGLEPVAVAVNNSDVWVVNHLSDSISVIDVSKPEHPFIKETILVGDEPRDIVFAGTKRQRAFITTARRGQNSPIDPELTTPGVGRALVWVYDIDRGASAGLSRSPLNVVKLFSDTPRALAVSPDKKYVYAAGFHTGNRTTTATALVTPSFSMPPPFTNFVGTFQPPSSLIVKHDGEHWRDEFQRNFDYAVSFDLPDNDVFVIDADARLPGTHGVYSDVGTVIYAMNVNPVTGKVYVMNTEALNEQRFEGPGTFAGHSVQGHHNLNRISVLSNGEVAVRHLNKHIDYSTCCEAAPNAQSVLSVALPMLGDVTADGSKVYVPFMGSSKVAIYDTRALEDDTFIPQLIEVGGGGPTGLILDEVRGQFYVMTRFDNAIRVVSLPSSREVNVVKMFNPEPPALVKGRRHLYDATRSTHGDSACASCHVFGDNDSLAWDLGNPDALNEANPNPFTVSPQNVSPFPLDPTFVALKGPMATQSLRGMANHGPMHWRGDRTGANEDVSVQPDSGAFDERAASLQFQAGFTDLLGVDGGLTSAELNEFTDFILQLYYPPNPIRNLDNSLTEQQAIGEDIFFNRPATIIEGGGAVSCSTCHSLDPAGNANYEVNIPGFFGSDGQSAIVAGVPVKVPHLRNIYTKVGKYGMPPLIPVVEEVPGASGHQGAQIRGFGFTHAGDFDTVVRFLSVTDFAQINLIGTKNPSGFPSGVEGLPLRQAVEAFLFAFDSNLKPIVGQQVTITNGNIKQTRARRTLMLEQARAGNCDLVARLPLLPSRFGRGNGMPDKSRMREFSETFSFSFEYRDDHFVSNTRRLGSVAEKDLWRWAEVSDNPLTLTCVPPGSGTRIGIDRDSDGIFDLDEHRQLRN